MATSPAVTIAGASDGPSSPRPKADACRRRVVRPSAGEKSVRSTLTFSRCVQTVVLTVQSYQVFAACVVSYQALRRSVRHLWGRAVPR
ncbi:hypothetical protein IG631_17943 [Alternaria alternata]|nr:hypothetical protein IG631_17943 [Alternaria alternata]